MTTLMHKGTVRLYWDRDVDAQGNPIRSDVRDAAHQIWNQACSRAESVLGDSTCAAELMEYSIGQISRYLDKKSAPLNSQNVAGLLMVAFWRVLQRHRARLSRLEAVGSATDLSERVPDKAWARRIEARLDAEKIVRLLSSRSRTILALRDAGYDWKEIAGLLEMTVPGVKNFFWREIRQVQLKLRACGDSKRKI